MTEQFCLAHVISIHALRVEGDKDGEKHMASSLNFYPRPPGGGRQAIYGASGHRYVFLSTPSGWRATYPRGQMC